MRRTCRLSGSSPRPLCAKTLCWPPDVLYRKPSAGFVLLRDAETGELMEVDTGSRRVRRQFARDALARRQALKRQFLRLGIDQLVVDTHHDYVIELQRFFRMRERRFR